MVRVSYVILTIILAAIISIGLASSQSTGTVYLISMDNTLKTAGLGGDQMVVNVGNVTEVTMTDPLVIIGSGTDIEEEQLSDSITKQNFDANHVIKDSAGQFNGADLSGYDLIVIGGPLHNSYAKMLEDQGYLKYTVTDKKMPTVVFETLIGPGGHKVVIIGDALGYTYHSKDLPTNGVIPEEMEPAAAATAGISLALIGTLLFNSRILSELTGKIITFFAGLAGSHIVEETSEVTMAKAKLAKRKTIAFGLSAKEIIIAFFCVFAFGIAFLYADRKPLTPEFLVIYIVVAGVFLVAHDLAHKWKALKFHADTEYKFWTLGTILIFLTSWLFGIAFAYPARTLVEGEELTPRQKSDIAFAGPSINLTVSLLFLLLIPLKFTTLDIPGIEILSEIGAVGFTVNMLAAVYNLIPFEPMDGGKIFKHSKIRWAVTFIPALVFYLAILTFVL